MVNRPIDDPAGILRQSHDTAGMLEHVCGHQTSLLRALEASRAACSTTIIEKIIKFIKNHQNPIKTNENQ